MTEHDPTHPKHAIHPEHPKHPSLQPPHALPLPQPPPLPPLAPRSESELTFNRLDADDAARALADIEQRTQSAPDSLRSVIATLHPADLAYVLEGLPLVQRQTVWALVRQAPATHDEGDVLLEVNDAVRETLIEDMSRAELVDAVAELEADEVADLAPDLPRDVVEEVASSMSLEEREQLRAAMSYPADSVGARMDFDMVTIRDDVSLEVVLRYLRRFDTLPPQTDQVFVIDRDERFMGSLPLSVLLLNEPDTQVNTVLRSEVLVLAAIDDIADAAQAFERYDLVSAPVVDAAGRLIGRLTIEAVVDVIREEGEEQALSSAGLREEEDVFAGLWDSLKNRGPWLLLNLCTASFAAFVASRFEDTVEHIVMLAFLMSIVAGIAGNSGNQTMTLLIRSLALGQITTTNLRRLVQKECAVTLAMGLLGGSVAGLFAWGISKRFDLGLVMMAAMVLNLLVGATIGIAVPIVRERMGKDPALGSSVLLTCATDTLGFLIFLGLATVFLL
jgi:magnesium transporter